MTQAKSPLVPFGELAALAGPSLGSGRWSGERKAAAARFAALGLPTTRQEAWRFTDLSPMGRASYAAPSAESEASISLDALLPLLFDGGRGHRWVFVDGRLSRRLSRFPAETPGARVESLLEASQADGAARLGQLADYESHPFVALNTASWSDGALVSVAPGAVLAEPIHLVFLATAGEAAVTSHPRVWLELGRSAQATVIESYVGLGGGNSFTNGVTEVTLGEDAILTHYRLQREAEEAFHLGVVSVRQERASSLRSFVFTTGARLSRVEIDTIFSGEGAECSLVGLYVARGRQLMDHQTSIDHATPHGTSRELYKGILDGRSRAVFNGRIVVRPDAQKTNAEQQNRNLILSDETMVNSKPQLEIRANDVKCAHGATVGQLDTDALFYLRSRGIPADRAARLLTYAFASELIGQVGVPALRDSLFRNLFSDLPHLEELREHT